MIELLFLMKPFAAFSFLISKDNFFWISSKASIDLGPWPHTQHLTTYIVCSPMAICLINLLPNHSWSYVVSFWHNFSSYDFVDKLHIAHTWFPPGSHEMQKLVTGLFQFVGHTGRRCFLQYSALIKRECIPLCIQYYRESRRFLVTTCWPFVFMLLQEYCW